MCYTPKIKFNFDDIVQTPKQALEKKLRDGDEFSMQDESIVFSDIVSELTPSESEVLFSI